MMRCGIKMVPKKQSVRQNRLIVKTTLALIFGYGNRTGPVEVSSVGFIQQTDLIIMKTQPDLVGRRDSKTVSFIDKFFLPVSAKDVFFERVRINRSFIRDIPGFIGDAAYESDDGNGGIHFITVALWESREALDKAKELVQEQYKKEGFDPGSFMESLNITMDRGIYTPVI